MSAAPRRRGSSYVDQDQYNEMRKKYITISKKLQGYKTEIERIQKENKVMRNREERLKQQLKGLVEKKKIEKESKSKEIRRSRMRVEEYDSLKIENERMKFQIDDMISKNRKLEREFELLKTKNRDQFRDLGKKEEELRRQKYGMEKNEDVIRRIMSDIEMKNHQLQRYSVSYRKLEALRSKHSELEKETVKVHENCSETHKELDHLYSQHREVYNDMKRLVHEHSSLVEEVFSKQEGPVLIAHDIDRDGSHSKYTKTLANYLFKSREALIGGYDYTKFQVCQYSPRLINENPDARFEVMLYFMLASGGRHAVPSNTPLFMELKKRCKKIYIIACRSKIRYTPIEDTSSDSLLLKEGFQVLNFLMARCTILENEHNIEVIKRIHDRLPVPVKPPEPWYEEKYVSLDTSRKFFKRNELYRPLISPTPKELMFDDVGFDVLPGKKDYIGGGDDGSQPTRKKSDDSAIIGRTLEKLTEEVRKIGVSNNNNEGVREKLDQVVASNLSVKHMISQQKNEMEIVMKQMIDLTKICRDRFQEVGKRDVAVVVPHIPERRSILAGQAENELISNLERQIFNLNNRVSELKSICQRKDDQISKYVKVIEFYSKEHAKGKNSTTTTTTTTPSQTPTTAPTTTAPTATEKDDMDEPVMFSENKVVSLEREEDLKNAVDGLENEVFRSLRGSMESVVEEKKKYTTNEIGMVAESIKNGEI